MDTKDPDSIPDSVLQSRAIERLITGRPTSDGAGVKLTRVIGGSLQQRLDPFLMLDAFRSDDAADYIGGFPDHPHRGFETVTYLIAGRMRHRDSAGNQGLLESGGMQWMLAGRGVIHSEMPEQEDGTLEGFQLWLNLPARDKLTIPAYRDVQSGGIPEFTTDTGTRVRVLLGESHGVAGAVRRSVTAPLLLDIHLPGGVAFSQPLPASHHACLYVYRGAVAVGGEAVADQQLAILDNSAMADGVTIDARGPARVLLIAGQPLHEPIVQHGPFVMNTEAEIRQAVADYQSGRLAAP